MNPAHFVRNLLPALLLTLGLTAATIAASSVPGQSRADAAVMAAPSPQPSSAPQTRITVNGQSVALSPGGTASVSLPLGQARVQSSGGQTTVTTTDAAGSAKTVSDNSNLDVSVQSASNHGTNVNETQVRSADNSATWSTSSSSTTVSGSGQSTITVNQ